MLNPRLSATHNRPSDKTSLKLPTANNPLRIVWVSSEDKVDNTRFWRQDFGCFRHNVNWGPARTQMGLVHKSQIAYRPWVVRQAFGRVFLDSGACWDTGIDVWTIVDLIKPCVIYIVGSSYQYKKTTAINKMTRWNQHTFWQMCAISFRLWLSGILYESLVER